LVQIVLFGDPGVVGGRRGADDAVELGKVSFHSISVFIITRERQQKLRELRCRFRIGSIDEIYSDTIP